MTWPPAQELDLLVVIVGDVLHVYAPVDPIARITVAMCPARRRGAPCEWCQP